MILSYILGLLLGAASFFSKDFLKKFEKKKSKFTSFTVGLSTVYVFLQLLPEAYQGISTYGFLLFISTLFGFSIFHIGERLITKYDRKTKTYRHLAILHLLIFFFYHAIVGITLVELLQRKMLSGILFALSLSFIYLTTSVLFEELHAKKGSHVLIKRILSAGTFLLGVIIAELFHINMVIVFPALGFISGVLIYIIGKEILPLQKASNPIYFTMGVILYTLILILLNAYGLL